LLYSGPVLVVVVYLSNLRKMSVLNFQLTRLRGQYEDRLKGMVKAEIKKVCTTASACLWLDRKLYAKVRAYLYDLWALALRGTI
jgi:hypothetical protein